MKNTYEEVVQSVIEEFGVSYETACEIAEEMLAFQSINEEGVPY